MLSSIIYAFEYVRIYIRVCHRDRTSHIRVRKIVFNKLLLLIVFKVTHAKLNAKNKISKHNIRLFIGNLQLYIFVVVYSCIQLHIMDNHYIVVCFESLTQLVTIQLH